MADEMGAKLERAVGRTRPSVGGRRGGKGNGLEEDGKG